MTYVDWISDGICDGMPYISEGCSYDGGDCTKCVLNATIDIRRIANGICDPELNTTECSWDGFDCIDAKKDIPCIVDDINLLGDGICNGGRYNTPQCDFDGKLDFFSSRHMPSRQVSNNLLSRRRLY